ncbi:MAG: MFS transporter [Alicyclobacillus sp.]|nr:MFS transporter [Alicyclobacillus sp.]
MQGVMMMAFTSTAPFLALYLEQIGVRNPAAVDIWAGLLQSANFVMMAIVSPLWGALGDRKGRKLMVLRTTFAVAVFFALMGLAQNVWELLVTRVLQGAFAGFSATAVSLVASITPEKRLGFALGWLQSSAMIGSLVGPLAGGLVSDWVHSYRAVFFLTAALGLVAFLLALFGVHEVRQPAGDPRRKPGLLGQFAAVRALKPLRVMFVVLFLAQFSVMSIQPVLPVFVEELAGHDSHLAMYSGLVFAATGLAGLVASPLLGQRSDRWGYRRTLTITLLGAGLCYLPQAFAPNLWVLMLARFGLGLFVGGIIPTANAWIGRMTPPEQRGQVYGFTSSATFLGSFAGPLSGGAGAAVLGIRTMLGVTMLLYLANAAWVHLRVSGLGASESRGESRLPPASG